MYRTVHVIRQNEEACYIPRTTGLVQYIHYRII